MAKKKPEFHHLYNYSISAVVAAVILVLGVLLGIQAIFGFGVFMMFLVVLLTAIAVVEYVLAIMR